MKNFFLFIATLLILVSCSTEQKEKVIKIPVKEGETVTYEIQDGHLTVNGREIPEGYTVITGDVEEQ